MATPKPSKAADRVIEIIEDVAAMPIGDALRAEVRSLVSPPMVSEQDMRRIAAEAGVDVRTVRRMLGGARPRSSATRAAVLHACAELGIEVPKVEEATDNPTETTKETTR